MSMENVYARKRRALAELKRCLMPLLRGSLDALIGPSICAVVLATIGCNAKPTAPATSSSPRGITATIFCDKPDVQFYYQDQFLGTPPVVFTEERAKSMFPEYEETIRTWNRGHFPKERERDLRSFIVEKFTQRKGIWIPLQATDERTYHYRETPWGRSIGSFGATGHAQGYTIDLKRRKDGQAELIQSWRLPNEPVAPGASCRAEVLLGSGLSADAINKTWRFQVHFRSFDDNAKERTPDPDAVTFEESPDSTTHFVLFDAPKEPGQYEVSLWLYSIPARHRGQEVAEDYEMITVDEISEGPEQKR